MDLRLPETIRPFHYTLWVQPFIYGNETMNGTVVMELEVTRSTSNITFHVAQMALMNEGIKVRERGGEKRERSRRRREKANMWLVIFKKSKKYHIF